MLSYAKSFTLDVLRKKAGFQFVRVPRFDASKERPPYEALSPLATYAPWNSDEDFQSAYEQIKERTLVDIYRCWDLWALVEQSAKLEGGIIEVGVWRGGTGALMASKAALCGIGDPVYLCDTFRGVVKAGAEDTIYKNREHADTSRIEVEAFVRERMKLDNVRILEGVFPDETADQIESQEARFRLCHIDVDVYQSAKDVMNWVWDRMVVGGVVVYDDFGFYGCEGVAKAVNEQLAEKDRLIFYNINGHAIVMKVPPR